MMTFCVPILYVLYSEHIFAFSIFFLKLNIVDVQYCVSFRYTQQGDLVTHMKVKVLVTQLCLTLSKLVDCSPPGSSVPGVFQARILEWVAVSSSRGPSRPRD